jgi:anti-sigma regulatory factor (Ser/Thr protein kinase)
LSRCLDWVKKQLPYALDGTTRNHIVLVTQELVTNAIIHGNEEKVDKQVTVTLHYDHKSVTLTIEDEGTIEYTLPSKEELYPMNTLDEGGRGLKLSVLLSDSISKEGRKLTLHFILP